MIEKAVNTCKSGRPFRRTLSISISVLLVGCSLMCCRQAFAQALHLRCDVLFRVNRDDSKPLSSALSGTDMGSYFLKGDAPSGVEVFEVVGLKNDALPVERYAEVTNATTFITMTNGHAMGDSQAHGYPGIIEIQKESGWFMRQAFNDDKPSHPSAWDRLEIGICGGQPKF